MMTTMMTMTVMTTMVMTAMMTMTMTMMSVVQCLSRPATFTQNFQRRARTTAALLSLWATWASQTELLLPGLKQRGVKSARTQDQTIMLAMFFLMGLALDIDKRENGWGELF